MKETARLRKAFDSIINDIAKEKNLNKSEIKILTYGFYKGASFVSVIFDNLRSRK
jgi:hypothetical protein